MMLIKSILMQKFRKKGIKKIFSRNLIIIISIWFPKLFSSRSNVLAIYIFYLLYGVLIVYRYRPRIICK